MARVLVPIYALEIGMYVAKLDVSWFRTPFLRHSFLIEHHWQIEQLMRAGVKAVEVDPNRGTADHAGRPAREINAQPEALSPVDSDQRLPPPQSLDQLNEEYAQAKIAKKQLDQSVQTVFSTFTKTGTIPPQQAAEAVQEITIVARTLPNSAIFMALSQNRAGDAMLSRHALTTCTLSLVMGQAFGLNPLELQELATAALLHDIGLLQIPVTVVQRSRVTSPPVSRHEERIFRTHPRLSALTLERQRGFEPVVLQLIGEHHAYLDGSGYPREIRGDFTSARARMLMIADTYDELITGFGGASPLSPHQALQRLYQDGQQGILDQTSLSHFIKLVGIYPVHSYVRLNTKELALVTHLNPASLHRPVIAITHGTAGSRYPSPIIVDLSREDDGAQGRTIEAILDTMPETSRGPSQEAA